MTCDDLNKPSTQDHGLNPYYCSFTSNFCVVIILTQIWDEVNNILFQQYNDSIKISVTDVLFGFKHEDELRCIDINKIMGVWKMCISKFRYGKHPNIVSLLYSELQIRNLYNVNNNT